MNKLYRDTENGMIAGVCSGLATFFGVSTALVRLLFLFSGGGFGLYIVLWIFLPEADYGVREYGTKADTFGRILKILLYGLIIAFAIALFGILFLKH